MKAAAEKAWRQTFDDPQDLGCQYDKQSHKIIEAWDQQHRQCQHQSGHHQLCNIRSQCITRIVSSGEDPSLMAGALELKTCWGSGGKSSMQMPDSSGQCGLKQERRACLLQGTGCGGMKGNA